VTGAIAGLAWLDALEGRHEECRRHASEALELADRFGMGFFRAWALIALGQLELGLGRPAAALEHFVACESLLAEIEIDDPDISPAPDTIDALVRLGRFDEARAVLDGYVDRAEAKGQPFALARAARARGLLSTDASYRSEFEAALTQHESTPDAFERARTQLYFGERLRRSRRRLDARAQLHAALRTFDALGAAPWAERAIAELTASGETARVRDDSSRQQLTPQELQVAMMLAEGLTTREAAARLYLSPKTVEYHLRHVYDKLEVRTRDDLRAALFARVGRTRERKCLMFTDLAGSTQLVEAIGDAAWRDLSAWLDAEVRKLLTLHGGREIDHAGDGFFVVFDTSRDGIECAIAIQRRLASHRRTQGYAPQIRIGIHEDDVQLEGSTVRGAAVHRAARLCAAARPDTILVSREAIEAAGRRPVGLREFELKGVSGRVQAAEISWGGAQVTSRG
jgi:class 3 adenylate cyclase